MNPKKCIGSGATVLRNKQWPEGSPTAHCSDCGQVVAVETRPIPCMPDLGEWEWMSDHFHKEA